MKGTLRYLPAYRSQFCSSHLMRHSDHPLAVCVALLLRILIILNYPFVFGFSLSSSLASKIPGWKIVCISDTHNFTPANPIPDGDILIHAGDFSNVGYLDEMHSFRDFLEKLPHRHKVFIAGNHDLPLDEEKFLKRSSIVRRYYPQFIGAPDNYLSIYSQQCIATVTKPTAARVAQGIKDDQSIIYLEDTSCDIKPLSEVDLLDDGRPMPPLRIYGSPWSMSVSNNWAFSLPCGAELKSKWSAIPTDADIVITHSPPAGILDQSLDGNECGCPLLYDEIMNRVKPRLHVFGHIHEGYGKLRKCLMLI